MARRFAPALEIDLDLVDTRCSRTIERFQRRRAYMSVDGDAVLRLEALDRALDGLIEVARRCGVIEIALDRQPPTQFHNRAATVAELQFAHIGHRRPAV